MTTITTMEVIERSAARVVTATSATCDDTCGVDAAMRKVPVLPAALYDESTEEDFDLLFRIAEDKTSKEGRLRRPTSAIPAVKNAGE